MIGKPDEQWGELPHAFVSLLPDKPVPSPQELVAFCKERLANYKCPRQIEIIDDLPKSGMGKILKTELRAKFWDGMTKKVN